MSCSSCSRSCSPSVMPVARNTRPRWLLIPGATSSRPSIDHRLGAQAGLLAQLAVRPVRRGSSVGQARRGALRELPAPQARADTGTARPAGTGRRRRRSPAHTSACRRRRRCRPSRRDGGCRPRAASSSRSGTPRGSRRARWDPRRQYRRAAHAGSLAGVLLASLNPVAVAAGRRHRRRGAHRRRRAQPQRSGRRRDVGRRTGRRRAPGGGAGHPDRGHRAGRHRLPDRRRAGGPGARRRGRRRTAAHPHRLRRAGVAGRGARGRRGPAAYPGAAARPVLAPLPRAVARRDRADHVHLRHHRAAEGRCAEQARRSPPTSTRWPRPGSGRPTTRWCTGFRCSTCTAWCSGCSARCGSETASCTPENRRRPATRPPQGSLYFGVPTVWSRVVADLDAARGAVVGAAAGVRQRAAAGAGVRPAGRAHRATSRSSGTAAPNR